MIVTHRIKGNNQRKLKLQTELHFYSQEPPPLFFTNFPLEEMSTLMMERFLLSISDGS